MEWGFRRELLLSALRLYDRKCHRAVCPADYQFQCGHRKDGTGACDSGSFIDCCSDVRYGGDGRFRAFPKQLVGLFLNPGDIAARIAIEGFPYIGAGFIFFIANLAVVGYYQSIGKVLPATCFAMLRGFMFLIPSFILLPRALGAVGIWLALPLSEILTAVVIAAVFRIGRRHSMRHSAVS